MLKTLVFDVNETLIDLSPVRLSLNLAFGREGAYSQWFTSLLHQSLVQSALGHGHDFSSLGLAALRAMNTQEDRGLGELELLEIMDSFRICRAHADVTDSLESLKAANYTLIALSNSEETGLVKLLQQADIASFFDHIISAERFRRYKPHAEVYTGALRAAKKLPEESVLISTHSWDLEGARSVGWKTAYLLREGVAFFPLHHSPDFLLENLGELAAALEAEKAP
ncbi:MAG: haloacid dehalogenase type II [Nitritalea sp.]